jgi:hypothetical protein
MSVVSQRLSRRSNAGGARPRENNAVSSGDAIGALGWPLRADLWHRKPLTCNDATRLGQDDSVLRLFDCANDLTMSRVLVSPSAKGVPQHCICQASTHTLALI